MFNLEKKSFTPVTSIDRLENTLPLNKPESLIYPPRSLPKTISHILIFTCTLNIFSYFVQYISSTVECICFQSVSEQILLNN